MPKKKLTKAQVKKTIRTIHTNIKKLFDDKFMSYGKSEVPMSANKLLEIGTKFSMARDRIK
jgi:hypothetical protein